MAIEDIMSTSIPQLTSAYLIRLTVDNIHCSSCVSYARDVLRPLNGVEKIDISIIEHIISVQYTGDASYSNAIVDELQKSAFEIRYVQVISVEKGKCVESYSVGHGDTSSTTKLPRWRFLMTRAQKAHVDHCGLCQDDFAANKPTLRDFSSLRLLKHHRSRHGRRSNASTWDEEQGKPSSATVPTDATMLGTLDSPKAVPDAEASYEATIMVEGMSCASCVSSITHAVEALQGIEYVAVNLIDKSALIRFSGPVSRSELVLTTIEEAGFDATLSSIKTIRPKRTARNALVATISISGMTCASCSGTIRTGLEALRFVTAANIDLLSNSATVYFNGIDNAPSLLEAIDDLGFGASIVGIKEHQQSPQGNSCEERVVDFDIKGMYCPECPQRFLRALEGFGQHQVSVIRSPSINHPSMKVAYKPCVPSLTVRTLLRCLDTVDSACKVSVHQNVSIEQRSVEVRMRERNRIARHLLVTFLAAIPSFIFGVVYMSMVSDTNRTKEFLEKPLSGQATRMEWALFITTTPAYFYGGALFHIKALKEIWSLWRPRSRIPLLRRFYRFGSMNLLISAGTSVAFFSSLAVLIMDATTHTSRQQIISGYDSMPKQSTTYFDTATFLILFILVGRYLEAYSKAKTGDAVSMLRSLQPQHALLLETDGLDNDHSKNNTKIVSIDMLEVGDIVNVAHGMCPPTDGLVDQEGSFLFDESSLTGESRPVPKKYGDKVLTGSKNVSGPVQIKVTSIGGQSMLDQIVDVVREGQAKRAPIERLADTLTGYFTPFITLTAITTWVIWLGLGQGGILPKSWLDVNRGGWPFWSLEFAIAVFVVACPCGIGLAAPTALFVGGGLAAKNGILAQGGGEAFQEASRIDAIVLDKTGTLTEGKMKVTDVEFLENLGENDDNMLGADLKHVVLSMAHALENSSTHPVAKAVAVFCADKLANASNELVKLVKIDEVPGKGMKGVFIINTNSQQATYEALVGNEVLLDAENSNDDEGTKEYKSPVVRLLSSWTTYTKLSQFQASGCSVAILAIRKIENEAATPSAYKPIAIFAVADPIRGDAVQVLGSLRARGLEIYMCTGDNPTTARAIASQVEIPVTHVRAGMLPQGKADFIKELQFIPRHALVEDAESHTKTSPLGFGKQDKSRRIVAFVGDGTNDSPALTVADVSIAISHPSSSDVALTSASFILLSSNLSSILTLVALSRRVFRRVKFNFFWAAVYNLCLIPIAAGVFFPINADWDPVHGHGGFRLNPVWAAAAMAGSSVSVVLSSLALKLPEVHFNGIWKLLRRTKAN